MTESILTTVLLPLALATIMFGMGLTLTGADFKRLWQSPRAMVLGLVGQLVLLPLLAALLIIVFQLPSLTALGLMLVAACPGGTTSNLFSFLARANVALSVSLTAFSTVICLLTTPLLIQLAFQWQTGSPPEHFSLLDTTIGLLLITLIPVSLGMLTRKKFTSWASRQESFFSRFTLVFLILMISAVVVSEWSLLMNEWRTLLPSSLALTLTATLLGLGLGWLGKLPKADQFTLGIEVGIQNATLTILIALSFLQRSDLATVAGLYGLTMYVGALLVVGISRWQSSRVKAAMGV